MKIHTCCLTAAAAAAALAGGASPADAATAELGSSGIATRSRPSCARAAVTTPDQTRVLSAHPVSYLRPEDLPTRFDWRYYQNASAPPGAPAVNLCNRVLTQQQPNVCGSCWAEAATSALSDRFTIATGGALRVQLAPQVLLNFDGAITGGSCLGGNSLDAYTFIHKYSITDDTCAPFVGMNYAWGFTYAAMSDVDKVRDHMCKVCDWEGNCDWVPVNSTASPTYSAVNHYTIDEFGNVPLGEKAMMAEIYARGPIACSIDSDPPAFDQYTGGVVRSSDVNPPSNDTDHVIVIAGWGELPAGQKAGSSGSDEPLRYWVGRNSYGSRWGEGAGGGWFRVQRGNNTLALEQFHCHFAVPAAADVARAVAQAQGLAPPLTPLNY